MQVPIACLSAIGTFLSGRISDSPSSSGMASGESLLFIFPIRTERQLSFATFSPPSVIVSRYLMLKSLRLQGLKVVKLRMISPYLYPVQMAFVRGTDTVCTGKDCRPFSRQTVSLEKFFRTCTTPLGENALYAAHSVGALSRLTNDLG